MASLNQQSELPMLEDLLPTEDSVLFKEPQPIASRQNVLATQDALTSLDLPDFSNFSIDDMDFGDLEFLDLAMAPVERSKRSNPTTGQFSDMVFNSLATPSGYCSANFLTEEANRLSALLSDTGGQVVTRDSGENLTEKSLLANLEELFGTQATGNVGKSFGMDDDSMETVIGGAPDDVVYEVPSDVLSLMAKNFENLQEDFDQKNSSVANDEITKMKENTDEFRQITIKSIQTLSGQDPPPGSVAKIVIKTSRLENFTRFTFASLDERESHSFQVNTADVKKATNALKPLNLDSVDVIRRLMKIGRKPLSAERHVSTSRRKGVEYDLVREVPTKPSETGPEIKIEKDEECSLKVSLLEYGIQVDSLVRITVGAGQRFWCCPEADCQKAYTKARELKLHLLGHYNIKPYRCTESGCSSAFLTRNKLIRHLTSHSKKKHFTCEVQGCGKQFTTVYNLNSHLKLHDRVFLHPCSLCEERFQTAREQQVHTSQVHRSQGPSLVCPLGCGKAYYTKSTLDAHVKAHETATEIKCTVCGKIFDKPFKLKQHMMFHTGEKPFACEFPGCSWRFPTNSKLSRHLRTHTNEKRFQCLVCSKPFSRPEHLHQHLQTHNKGGTAGQVRHLQCQLCGQELGCREDLNTHMKGGRCCSEKKTGQAVENLNTASQVGDLNTGQLDFVALLSSVGEEVVTEDGLNCPEYEISSNPPHEIPSNPPTQDILATSLALNNLGQTDQGEMMQLLQVGTSQVLRIEDCGGEPGRRTLMLRPLSSKEDTGPTFLPTIEQSAEAGQVANLTILGPGMDLETLDTTAISPQRGKRKRSGEGGGQVRGHTEGGGQPRAKVAAQDWHQANKVTQVLAVTPSTINLQDLA